MALHFNSDCGDCWILSFWTRTVPADRHWLMIPSSEIWATETFRLQEHFKLNLCVLPSSLISLFHCVTFAYKSRLETITGWYFSCFPVAHWQRIWKKIVILSKKFFLSGSGHSDHRWRKIYAPGELYIFAIAIYASIYSPHFNLISLSVYHSGTLLMRLKYILIKWLSQTLMCFREGSPQLDNFHCLGISINYWQTPSMSSLT